MSQARFPLLEGIAEAKRRIIRMPYRVLLTAFFKVLSAVSTGFHFLSSFYLHQDGKSGLSVVRGNCRCKMTFSLELRL